MSVLGYPYFRKPLYVYRMQDRIYLIHIQYTCIPGWWFGTVFIVPYIEKNNPNWLIFFRRVETTNQIHMYSYIAEKMFVHECKYMHVICGRTMSPSTMLIWLHGIGLSSRTQRQTKVTQQHQISVRMFKNCSKVSWWAEQEDTKTHMNMKYGSMWSILNLFKTV